MRQQLTTANIGHFHFHIRWDNRWEFGIDQAGNLWQDYEAPVLVNKALESAYQLAYEQTREEVQRLAENHSHLFTQIDTTPFHLN